MRGGEHEEGHPPETFVGGARRMRGGEECTGDDCGFTVGGDKHEKFTGGRRRRRGGRKSRRGGRKSRRGGRKSRRGGRKSRRGGRKSRRGGRRRRR